MNTDASTNQDTSQLHEDAGSQASFAQKLDEYLANEYDVQTLHRGDIRAGTVVQIGEQGVIMDIGSKLEGIVPTEDLENLDDESRSEILPGASIPVFVTRTADRDGRPVLSIQQARMYEDWIKAEQMMQSGELYEGEVSSYNRGGIIVKFGKIRGFVPTSQIAGLPRRLRDDQRRQHLEAMIGQRIGLRVIEVDRQRRRLIFSQRRALRAWQEMQRERVITELSEGETRHGKVTSITDFGAFVDLGGADGLIHVSELSWRRIDNPREALKIGQEVDVYVLSVDQQRKRIALSLKKLMPDPWTLVDDTYQIGQLVEGRVTRVLDFGAFVELDRGIEGLLHSREMMGTPELTPADIVQPGDTLPLKIIRIDSRRRRLDLSAKQVQKSEWEQWAAEHHIAQQEEETALSEPEAASQAAEESAAPEVEVEAEAEAIVESEVEPAAPEAEEIVESEVEAAAPEAEAIVESEVEPAAPEAEVIVESQLETAAQEAAEEIPLPEAEVVH